MSGQTDNAQFAAIFDKLSADALRALTPTEFQRFVAYVFTRAGYETKSRPLGFITDVDLDLFAVEDRRKQVGAVAVQQTPAEQPLSGQLVRKVQRSAAVRKLKEGATYIVTSGSYDKTAYEQARSEHQTHLLNGEQFCRYARYVRHSRFPEGTGLTVVIPPDPFSEEPLSPQGLRRTKVLVLANNKGGVGKTTSARRLALNMASRGLRVLAIDVDPQGNLTEGLLHHGATEVGHPLADSPNLVQYFARECILPQLVRPTFIENEIVSNVFLIPAHPDLSLLDTGGAGRPALEMRFARDLLALVNTPPPTGDKLFDWAIIDTPPAISLFTRAALCAADYVVAPARSRPSSLRGIQNMVMTMDTMGELRGTPPKLLGCLLTHWDDDQHSTETFPDLEALFDNHHSRILANYIPFDVTIEKMHGPTRNRARDAYERVTQEVLDYVQRN